LEAEQLQSRGNVLRVVERISQLPGIDVVRVADDERDAALGQCLGTRHRRCDEPEQNSQMVPHGASVAEPLPMSAIIRAPAASEYPEDAGNQRPTAAVRSPQSAVRSPQSAVPVKIRKA